MKSLLAIVRSWATEVLAGWNKFWFQPADPATLGIIRICTGSMLLYTHLVWSLKLTSFIGPNGWLTPSAVHQLQQGSYTWSYLWWFESAWSLWIVHLAALVVFGMLAVGWHSRIAAVLSTIAALSYVGRVPGALFGLDQINCMLAMYLAVGPSGAAFSLDRWLAQRRTGTPLPVNVRWDANLAIRLIQIHMCVIYMFAGMAKLTGAAWWDGTAMWMALGNMEYQSTDMTWMADWPRTLNLLSHVTVFWELFYTALVWPRLTRPIVLLLAIPLHLGIAICLGMTTFGLIMLVGNFAFVRPEWIRAFAAWYRSRRGRAGEATTPATSKNPVSRAGRSTARTALR